MSSEIDLVPVQLYEDWLPALAPPWLQGPRGRALLSGWGQLLDEHASLIATGVLARFVERAPEDALNLLGTERGLVRFPGESLEAYRARVLAAWEFWSWVGTRYGMERYLAAAGYRVFIREHYLDDRAIWAEFSVWLWPEVTVYTTDRWNEEGVWDDGSPWDYFLGGAEIFRIPALIREMKPAHAKPRTVWYVPGPYDAWDDGGNWDDGGSWNPEPVQIL